MYGKDVFHGMLIDDFSVLTINSTAADNNESTLSAGNNDFENDTDVYTTFTLAK